ncbi:MAG: site-specific integrase, partial [Actinomycetota bacterium]|nr:site-specific integrase [Actinomycetota bacterium]
MTAPERVVADYLDHLAVERGRSANTLRSYRGDLDRYTAHLSTAGIDDLGAVRERDVSAFVSALRRGSPPTQAPLAASSAARA